MAALKTIRNGSSESSSQLYAILAALKNFTYTQFDSSEIKYTKIRSSEIDIKKLHEIQAALNKL